MLCYCGNTLDFENCCQAIITGKKIAVTPEQLMRSRYSAYVIKNAHYIFKTYATATRQKQSVSDIQQWADQTQWLKLTVLSSDDIHSSEYINNTPNDLPRVEFTAWYFHNKTLCKMTESSRFIYENEQWLYLDGDVEEHEEIAMPKRNTPCPCGSNKKFKHCCLIKLSY